MEHHYNIRLNSIFFFFLFLYVIALFNLYIIQIKKSDYFKTLGQQQYHVTITSMPPRAEIYDRAGQLLATNKERLSAFIIPSRIENIDKVKTFLAKNFKHAYARLEKNPALHFMYIKRRLTEQQIELINQAELPDIKFLKEPSRFYPIESTGPVIGITDLSNQGIMGIELLYNSQLAGQKSIVILEKDARSGHFYFKRETKIQGIYGTPITLSIDSTLQFLVYEELKSRVNELSAKEGAVLILNPENGEILVMAHYPDFNPNNTQKLDISATRNRIITDAYELGSVIKAFLALAALEENVVTPGELIDCENTLVTVLDGIKFSTWKAHGAIPFNEVIKGSNNIGVAKVAQRLGSKIYDHYKRLGFGEKIGIFAGENRGFINPPSSWSKASIISLSFGYEISSTILQLAQAMSIIANNGYIIKPRLIKLSDSEQITKSGPLYKQETIDTLKEILRREKSEAIINKLNKESENNYIIRGKTGTARLLTNGKYDPNRTIYTFAGMLEKGDYKRIIITFIKEIKDNRNVYASTVALPLFEQIAHKLIIHDKVY